MNLHHLQRLGILLLPFLCLAPRPGHAASYAPLDCAKASTAAETAVCKTYALGQDEARLSTLFGVLTSLVAHPKGLAFPDLRRLCGLTDGNLSRHLTVLQEADLVSLEKGYDHNRPQTLCRLTTRGRSRFLDYLAVLEQVVRDAAKAAERAPEAAAFEAKPA